MHITIPSLTNMRCPWKMSSPRDQVIYVITLEIAFEILQKNYFKRRKHTRGVLYVGNGIEILHRIVIFIRNDSYHASDDIRDEYIQ